MSEEKKTTFDLLETCVTLYLSLFYNLFWNGFISQDTAVSYELITRRLWLQWLKSTIKTFTFGILISGLMPRWAIQSIFTVQLSAIFCRFGAAQHQDAPKRDHKMILKKRKKKKKKTLLEPLISKVLVDHLSTSRPVAQRSCPSYFNTHANEKTVQAQRSPRMNDLLFIFYRILKCTLCCFVLITILLNSISKCSCPKKKKRRGKKGEVHRGKADQVKLSHIFSRQRISQASKIKLGHNVLVQN